MTVAVHSVIKGRTTAGRNGRTQKIEIMEGHMDVLVVTDVADAERVGIAWYEAC